jgi:hypothetical protein
VRTDGHRSRKQAGNGHWSRSSSKWRLPMIARACITKMMATARARFAVSAIALSVLCRDVNKTADADPEFNMMIKVLQEFAARFGVKLQRQRICEPRPFRLRRQPTQTLRQSGPWRFEDEVRLSPDLEPDRLTHLSPRSCLTSHVGPKKSRPEGLQIKLGRIAYIAGLINSATFCHLSTIAIPPRSVCAVGGKRK